MLAKLSADILDKLDIFILEIEELSIPKVDGTVKCYRSFVMWYNFSHFGGNTFGASAFCFRSLDFQQYERIELNACSST